MGAEFDYRTITGTQDEALKKWNNEVDSSLYESGHSYSGGIGMLGRGFDVHTDAEITTQEDAVEYIADNHEKWEGAMAITIKKGNVQVWIIGGWCSS